MHRQLLGTYGRVAQVISDEPSKAELQSELEKPGVGLKFCPERAID